MTDLRHDSLASAAEEWDSYHWSGVLEAVSREVWGAQSANQFSSVTPGYVAELAGRLELGQTHCVIDLGCGSGGLSLHLSETSGCAVVGVDISSEAVRAARTRAARSRRSDRCRFVVGHMSDPPLSPRSADVIVCFGSAYWSEPKRTVPRWSSLLRDGIAAIVIVVTRILAPHAELDRRLTLQSGLYSPHPDWEGGLADNGFTVDVRDLSAEHADYVSRTYEALCRHRDELEAELGERDAAAYLAQDERLASYARDGKLKRVEIVAARRTGA